MFLRPAKGPQRGLKPQQPYGRLTSDASRAEISMNFPALAASFEKPQFQKLMKLFKPNDCIADCLYTNISEVIVAK